MLMSGQPVRDIFESGNLRPTRPSSPDGMTPGDAPPPGDGVPHEPRFLAAQPIGRDPPEATPTSTTERQPHAGNRGRAHGEVSVPRPALTSSGEEVSW